MNKFEHNFTKDQVIQVTLIHFISLVPHPQTKNNNSNNPKFKFRKLVHQKLTKPQHIWLSIYHYSNFYILLQYHLFLHMLHNFCISVFSILYSSPSHMHTTLVTWTDLPCPKLWHKRGLSGSVDLNVCGLRHGGWEDCCVDYDMVVGWCRCHGGDFSLWVISVTWVL